MKKLVSMILFLVLLATGSQSVAMTYLNCHSDTFRSVNLGAIVLDENQIGQISIRGSNTTYFNSYKTSKMQDFPIRATGKSQDRYAFKNYPLEMDSSIIQKEYISAILQLPARLDLLEDMDEFKAPMNFYDSMNQKTMVLIFYCRAVRKIFIPE